LNQTLTDDDEQKRKPYCVASFALSGGDLDVEDPQIITISHSDGNLHRRHCYLLQDLLRWFDSSAPIRDQNRRRVYMLPLSGTFVYENAVNALASGLHADGVRHWVSYAGPDQVMVGNDMQRIYQLAPLETIMRSIRNSALRRDAMPPPPR
jgi:hypothetical protein